MKKPPIYLYPLMFASALAAIIAVGWMLTQWADTRGDKDEVLCYRGLSIRP